MRLLDCKLNLVVKVCNLEYVHKMNQDANKFVSDNLHPFHAHGTKYANRVKNATTRIS